MPKLREYHKKIMHMLADKHEKTRVEIAEQEQEMVQLFRQQLFEVESKLKKNTANKSSSDKEGGVPRAWLDKSAKLTRELEHYKAESMRLDTENERLEKVRSRVLGEHRSHQDDTQYLETQMAALKRENLKLKREVEYEAGESMRVFLARVDSHPPPNARDSRDSKAFVEEWEQEDTAGAGGRGGMVGRGSGKATEEELSDKCGKMREQVARVRKVIDEERVRQREVRTAHVQALAERTQLQGFLSQCVEDVEKEISRHQVPRPPLYTLT